MTCLAKNPFRFGFCQAMAQSTFRRCSYPIEIQSSSPWRSMHLFRLCFVCLICGQGTLKRMHHDFQYSLLGVHLILAPWTQCEVLNNCTPATFTNMTTYGCSLSLGLRLTYAPFCLENAQRLGVDEVTFGKIFGWHIDLQSGDDGRRILNLASAARWYAGGVLWRPALAWTPVNHFIDLLFAYLGPHLARCWVHLRCFAVKVRLVQCPPTVRSKTRVWTIRSSWDLAVISTVGLAVVISIETRFCYNVPRNLDSKRVRSDSGAESLHNRRQLQKVWFNRDTGANSQM